jgi:hypothetical protein
VSREARAKIEADILRPHERTVLSVRELLSM